MDFSVTFARHFSRLVWLLLNDAANVAEQKAALRAVTTVSKEGAVTIVAQDWRLLVNGEPLPEALTGVQDLAAQLIGHAVAELRFAAATPPAELLGLARILAVEAVPGDGGENIKSKLGALNAASVTMVVRGTESLMRGATPPIGTAAIPAPGTSTGAPASVGASAGIVNDEESGLYLAFSAVQAATGTAAELIAQLDATKAVNTTSRVLDELVTLAENAQREGRTEVVADAFHAVVVREAAAPEGDLKRAYVMAVRRMSKPTLLRAVAQMFPKRRERLDDYMLVLSRTGEDGADALIEQLTSASSLAERRVYFDALLRLNSGVSALVHMLGDARWYVSRNAAELLGEMQSAEAEGPLAELLKHDDDRVRRASATALAKIGTPKAIASLHAALKDNSPQVRLQAASGLAARKGDKSSATLVMALDGETDNEVQLAIISALGRLGTPDAVQKLIKAAEADGRFFKKKSVAFRVAAVQALGEAKTGASLAALQGLASDREKEVREAVIRIFAQQAAQAQQGRSEGEGR